MAKTGQYEELLKHFQGRPERNLWIEEDTIRVYLRKSKRSIFGKRRDTLDIGSVEVPEQYRNRGVFTRFLDDAEAFCDRNGLYLYVENVLSDRLDSFMSRREGYRLLHSIGLDESAQQGCYVRAPKRRLTWVPLFLFCLAIGAGLELVWFGIVPWMHFVFAVILLSLAVEVWLEVS